MGITHVAAPGRIVLTRGTTRYKFVPNAYEHVDGVEVVHTERDAGYTRTSVYVLPTEEARQLWRRLCTKGYERA